MMNCYTFKVHVNVIIVAKDNKHLHAKVLAPPTTGPDSLSAMWIVETMRGGKYSRVMAAAVGSKGRGIKRARVHS